MKGPMRGPRKPLVTYRDYKRFDNQVFNLRVRDTLDSIPIIVQKDFSLFNSTVKHILNKQAPLKQKYPRANDAPFTSKNLRKAIIKRSRLKKGLNRNRKDENWLSYKTKRNLCVKILRQNNKSYYAKIDTKAVYDKKRFWKVVKPMFSNKVQNNVKSDEKEVAEILNDYFITITQTLGISHENKGNSVKCQMQSSCEGIIRHFQSHPSIHHFDEPRASFSIKGLGRDLGGKNG